LCTARRTENDDWIEEWQLDEDDSEEEDDSEQQKSRLVVKKNS
jgi:hypothetical protein